MASKILIVDDEPKWLRIVTLYLENRQYEVSTATSGEEALKKIADSPPDVVIADIGMPGMDGYELCSHLRSDPRTRTIPFIFFTARDHDQDRIRASKIGSDDYLTKPCPLQRIAQSVEAVMDRIEQARAIPLEGIGMSGRLEDIDLLDMVQTLELEQKTGALLLSHGERTGTLYFRDGVIVQAGIRSPKREEPLFVLLGWKTGRFMFLPDAQPEQLPITASVANLLFEDLRMLEEHERNEQLETPPSEPTGPSPPDPGDLTALTLARLQYAGQQLAKLLPSAQRPAVIRLLVAGVARSGVSEMLEALVRDLSGSRWAAVGTEEPWAAYRTEVGRVRISPAVVLHLIAVRAEKRFWPLWERCLPTAHGILLLVLPATKGTAEHCSAFLKAQEILAPGLSVHALTAEHSEDLTLNALGLAAEQISRGSPEDRTIRLTAVNRVLQQWLNTH
jgi:DNA-binding response OmpR family regulator